MALRSRDLLRSLFLWIMIPSITNNKWATQEAGVKDTCSAVVSKKEYFKYLKWSRWNGMCVLNATFNYSLMRQFMRRLIKGLIISKNQTSPEWFFMRRLM